MYGFSPVVTMRRGINQISRYLLFISKFRLLKSKFRDKKVAKTKIKHFPSGPNSVLFRNAYNTHRQNGTKPCCFLGCIYITNVVGAKNLPEQITETHISLYIRIITEMNAT